MIKVMLKAGSLMELEDGSRAIDAAMKISEGLARASVAGEINGETAELTTALHDGDTLNILTFRRGEEDIPSHHLAYISTGSKTAVSGHEACHWSRH